MRLVTFKKGKDIRLGAMLDSQFWILLLRGKNTIAPASLNHGRLLECWFQGYVTSPEDS